MTSFKFSSRHEKEKQNSSKNRRLVQNDASTHPAWPCVTTAHLVLACHYLDQPFAERKKKSLWKSNFRFPWQLTWAWSNQGTHPILFVPLRSAQQADELLETTIFSSVPVILTLLWILHQRPYFYPSTLSDSNFCYKEHSFSLYLQMNILQTANNN